MKKLIAIVLCLAMALSMVACGRDVNPAEDSPKVKGNGIFQEAFKGEPTEEELEALRQYHYVMEELEDYADGHDVWFTFEEFGMEADVDHVMGQQALALLYQKLAELETVDKWVGTEWAQGDINWDRQAVLDSFVVVEDVALRETKTYLDYIGNEAEDARELEWDYDMNGRVTNSSAYGFHSEKDDFWYCDAFAEVLFSGVVGSNRMPHYTYDENGVIEKIEYGYSTEDVDAVKTFTYEDEKIVGEHVIYANGDKIDADYRYDSQGRLEEVTYIEGDSEFEMYKWIYRYAYDSDGKVCQETMEKYRWDYNFTEDFVMEVTIVTTYTYNADGVLISGVSKSMQPWSFNEPSEMPTEFTYTCDAQGRPVAVSVSCGDRILSATGEPVWDAEYPACQVEITYGDYYIYTPAMK